MTVLRTQGDRRGEWIQTYTGKAFWPLDIRPGDIVIEDIAHSLAMQCRYLGHCLKFYSVAEHCVILSWLVEPEWAWHIFHHDDHEAYTGDLPRPYKWMFKEMDGAFAQLLKIYDDVQRACAEELGFLYELPKDIKRFDDQMLIPERAQNMAKAPFDWEVKDEGICRVVLPLWSPRKAEQMFLARYWELKLQRAEAKAKDLYDRVVALDGRV